MSQAAPSLGFKAQSWKAMRMGHRTVAFTSSLLHKGQVKTDGQKGSERTPGTGQRAEMASQNLQHFIMSFSLKDQGKHLEHERGLGEAPGIR